MLKRMGFQQLAVADNGLGVYFVETVCTFLMGPSTTFAKDLQCEFKDRALDRQLTSGRRYPGEPRGSTPSSQSMCQKRIECWTCDTSDRTFLQLMQLGAWKLEGDWRDPDGREKLSEGLKAP